MSKNLYSGPPYIAMIDSGTFWRCDHGHTHFGERVCWRCGIWHPIKFAQAFIRSKRGQP